MTAQIRLKTYTSVFRLGLLQVGDRNLNVKTLVLVVLLVLLAVNLIKLSGQQLEGDGLWLRV
jgi:hypothetical protein